MREVDYGMFNWKQWLCLLLLPISINVLAQKDESVELRPGTVIYKIDANASPSDLKGLNALLKSQGLVSERTLEGSQIVIATFEHHGRETAIANIIDKSGYVEFAEPDYVVEPTLQPNDTFFANQWHHNNVNSQQAWDITTGSHTVLVGVCDTGFDVNHPDLGPNLRTDLAFNAHDGSTNIFDANGHGTGSAGTLGAVGNNGIGVAGANWEVDIIPVRIAISDQNSSAYISTMATCIEYAADNGARVVNLSYGGIQYDTIDAAAQYLRSKNGLLFMSAGNSSQEHSYPDFTSFIGVGATDRDDSRASFSSWGNYVDITAPGVDIATTYPDDQYVYYSGTSFSSPLTAGIAALMVAANPAITPAEIETGLFSTAVDIGAAGDDNVFGHGLVDAYAAVMYAMNLNNLEAPVADIVVSSNSVPFGSSVDFDGSGSTDGDGTIVSYLWDFGDGNTSASMMATHTYAQAGSFQVSLTVTDDDGLSDSALTNIQVTNMLPTPVLEISNASSSYDIGESIFFIGSNSTDPDGNIVSYQWEFGNGATSSSMDPEYAYASAGTYTVTLTVTDNAGSANSTDVMVTIVDPFVVNAPTGLTASVDGLSVTLTWQDNSANEDEYVVERGAKYRGRVRFEQVAVLPMDSTSYVDTVPNTGEFSYRITARNTNDEATSDTIKVTVDSNTDPEPEPGGLAAPTNLVASSSGGNVNLSWSDNSGDELGFYIERGLKRKGQIDFAPIGQAGANETSFTDSEFGSLPNGNYAYRVQAYKSGEVSGYSNTSEVRKK